MVLHLYIKMVLNSTKQTLDQLVFYQYYQKYLKEYFLSKCQIFLMIFYQTNNAYFGKNIVRGIAFWIY